MKTDNAMRSMDHGKRIYYTMGEVSEMFDVNPSLIRFWEQKFDILKPHKNKKGNRMFTPRDVDNLKLIYHLVKEKGMTLTGAEKRLKENREGLEKNLEVIDKLQGIKSLLLEIKQELNQDNQGYEEILIEPAHPMEEAPGKRIRSMSAQPVAEIIPAPETTSAPEQPVVCSSSMQTPPVTETTPVPMQDQPDAETASAAIQPPVEIPAPPARPLIIEQTLF